MPGTYGILAGFNFDRYDAQEAEFKKLKDKTKVTIAFIAMSICAPGTILYNLYIQKQGILYSFGAGFGGFFVGIAPGGLIALAFEFILKPAWKSRFPAYFTHKDKIAAYRADLAAWEFTNTESGLGYWQGLRGMAFENAAAALFRRRGCEVTTTKGSGDGGVDLVLNLAGKAYWCQCKAYAKPVSVAPIREIAGVCSRGQAMPVLLAVNGYTKPALDTANELGVRCLDAHHLCTFARMETIISID